MGHLKGRYVTGFVPRAPLWGSSAQLLSKDKIQLPAVAAPPQRYAQQHKYCNIASITESKVFQSKVS